MYQMLLSEVSRSEPNPKLDKNLPYKFVFLWLLAITNERAFQPLCGQFVWEHQLVSAIMAKPLFCWGNHMREKGDQDLLTRVLKSLKATIISMAKK